MTDSKDNPQGYPESESIHGSDKEVTEVDADDAIAAAEVLRAYEEQSESLEIIKAHSGPLPSPEQLAGYEAVTPGLAERIVRMAEKQMDHRLNYESKEQANRLQLSSREQDIFQEEVVGRHKMTERGQKLGFLLTYSLGIAGMLLAMAGHSVVASVIFGTTIVSIAAVFVIGRLQKESSHSSDKDVPGEES